jgi:hypothetical protein
VSCLFPRFVNCIDTSDKKLVWRSKVSDTVICMINYLMLTVGMILPSLSISNVSCLFPSFVNCIDTSDKKKYVRYLKVSNTVNMYD